MRHILPDAPWIPVILNSRSRSWTAFATAKRVRFLAGVRTDKFMAGGARKRAAVGASNTHARCCRLCRPTSAASCCGGRRLVARRSATGFDEHLSRPPRPWTLHGRNDRYRRSADLERILPQRRLRADTGCSLIPNRTGGLCPKLSFTARETSVDRDPWVTPLMAHVEAK